MLELETIEDYFSYIIESKINGQHIQARALCMQLSEGQKDDFLDWVETTYHYDAEPGEMADEISKLKVYLNGTDTITNKENSYGSH